MTKSREGRFWGSLMCPLYVLTTGAKEHAKMDGKKRTALGQNLECRPRGLWVPQQPVDLRDTSKSNKDVNFVSSAVSIGI